MTYIVEFDLKVGDRNMSYMMLREKNGLVVMHLIGIKIHLYKKTMQSTV